jgi:hypothetical protein
MTVNAAMTGFGVATKVYGGMQEAKGLRAAGRAAAQTAAYNAKIDERNAKVAENEARFRIQRGDYEATQFAKDFQAMQAAASTRYLKSGVQMTGTPLLVLAESAAEADEEKKTIALVARTDAGRMEEKAREARLRGQITLLEGRQRQQAFNIRARSATMTALSDAAFGGYRVYKAIV